MDRTGCLALAAVLITACGGGQSSASSSPTAPTTPSKPTYDWVVTHRFESVSGPDNCWVQLQRASLTGVVFSDLEFSVTRANGSIRFESPWFQTYVGTLNGTDFSARGEKPLEGGGKPCADGTSFTQLPGVTELSGRFSADDQSMTATEVNSYLLNTGEPVTYRWNWQATRRK